MTIHNPIAAVAALFFAMWALVHVVSWMLSRHEQGGAGRGDSQIGPDSDVTHEGVSK